MPNQIDLYLKLKYRIQDWLLGTDDCCDLANFCGLPLSSFKENLIMWGLMDVNGAPRVGTSEQDVFNAIFMLELKRLITQRVFR